jgi:hypothetical protein
MNQTDFYLISKTEFGKQMDLTNRDMV